MYIHICEDRVHSVRTIAQSITYTHLVATTKDKDRSRKLVERFSLCSMYGLSMGHTQRNMLIFFLFRLYTSTTTVVVTGTLLRQNRNKNEREREEREGENQS